MKSKFLASSLLVTILILSSCGDDSKDTSPNNQKFSKEDFYGVWEENGSASSGCTEVIKIDATKFYFGIKCGADFTYDNGATYAFEDNEFAFSNSGYWRFKILSKTSSTFKTQRFIETADMGEFDYTKL